MGLSRQGLYDNELYGVNMQYGSENMKKSCLILILIICFLFSGCDKNKDKDINVSEYPLYVNNTEHYDIATYNSYKCTEYDETKNEDGSYTVTFKFSKIGVD